MKLYDIFSSLPKDMVFKSHLDGTEHTSAEWADILKNDLSEASIGDATYSYGKISLKIVYFPGIGPAFRECRDA